MDSRTRPPVDDGGASRPGLPGQPPPFRGGGDPWAAFGYLVSGVAVYGVIGFGLGRWLNAPFLTAVGIVVGATLGIYLVIRQFGPGAPTSSAEAAGDRHDSVPGARTPREGRGEPAE